MEGLCYSIWLVKTTKRIETLKRTSLSFCRKLTQIFLLPILLFLPIELLRSSRKEDIAAAVEGGFNGVLNDTDDETDSDRLHGDIITDTEELSKSRDIYYVYISSAGYGNGSEMMRSIYGELGS